MADPDAEVEMGRTDDVDSSEYGSQEDDAKMDVVTESIDEEILAQLYAVENGDAGTPFFQGLFNLVKDAYNDLMDRIPCDTESCGSASLGYDSGEAGSHTPSDSGRDDQYIPGSAKSEITISPSLDRLAHRRKLRGETQQVFLPPLGASSSTIPQEPSNKSPPKIVESTPSSIASEKSRQQNSIVDSVSTADTSIISEFLTERLKNGGSDILLNFTRDRMGTAVVRLIAERMHNEDIPFDVRKAMPPVSSAEREMQVMLSKVAAAYASSSESKCYLCGGILTGEKVEIEEKETRIDQVDHKVPCKTFYAMFRYVKREFPDEYSEWIQYIDSDYIKYRTKTKRKEDRLKYLYSVINNSSELTEETLNKAFKLVEDGFNKYLEYKNITFPDAVMERFKRITRAYLLEFAYTHHVCNQVKSDNDLSVSRTLNEYYRTLITIVGTKNIDSWKYMRGKFAGYRNPACLNYPDIAEREFDNIRSGLGITGKKKLTYDPTKLADQTILVDRKRLVQLEISTIMEYGRLNARDLNLSMKRSMIRAIREILSVQKNIQTGFNKTKSTQKTQAFNVEKFNQTWSTLGKRYQNAKKLCDGIRNTLKDMERPKQPRSNVITQSILAHWNQFKFIMSGDGSELLDGLADVIRNKSIISPDAITKICSRVNEYFDKLKCIDIDMRQILAIPTYKLLLSEKVTDNIDDIMSGNGEHMRTIYENITNLCPDIPREIVSAERISAVSGNAVASSSRSVGSRWSNELGGGSRKCMTRKCRRSTRKRRAGKKPRRTMRLRQRRNNKRTLKRRK